jgi:hypothetical protein
LRTRARKKEHKLSSPQVYPPLNTVEEPLEVRERPLVSKVIGAILTIVGGVLYVLGSFLGTAMFGGFFAALLRISSARGGTVSTSGLTTALTLLLALGITAGGLIILGGILLNSDRSQWRKVGGILAIGMALIGFIPSLGGFALGFCITLMGAILGLTYKESGQAGAIGGTQGTAVA